MDDERGLAAPWQQPPWIERTQLILNSFKHWLKYDLTSREGSALEQAARLFNASFVVVAHGTEPDPILNYGNRAALQLWEMDLEQLTSTPSRMTAEPLHREERSSLLTRTTRDGYVDDYRGVRISRTGKRFRIDRAIVWNLVGPAGEYRGQVATFSQWEYLDPLPKP